MLNALTMMPGRKQWGNKSREKYIQVEGKKDILYPKHREIIVKKKKKKKREWRVLNQSSSEWGGRQVEQLGPGAMRPGEDKALGRFCAPPLAFPGVGSAYGRRERAGFAEATQTAEG
jgi:hypothetical protein